MRIVFMGTPEFAAIVLEHLTRSHDIVGVFTQPDAVRSRGKKLQPSPVKQMALGHSIPVFECASFKENDAFDRLAQLNPDVICVAAYGVLLPKAVLDLPRFGCLNVHGSLLPRWRGAAPIERAILAGDKEIGVCVMQMEEGLDTGDFCMVRSIPVASLSVQELTFKLARLGAEALLEALDGLEQGSLAWTAQDKTLASYANKIEKDEFNIEPDMSAEEALRIIRASSDSHPARCSIGGKAVSLISAALVNDDLDQDMSAGQVFFIAKKLYLGFSCGALELHEVHPSGKKLMAARDFAAGLQGVKQGKVSWSAYVR